MKYIDVVVDNKSDQTDNFYTYKAPDNVFVGAKLSVPFARRKNSVDAYCVAEDVKPKFDISKIKEIDGFDEKRSLNKEMIETSIWMKKRVGTKYIDAIKLFTVNGKKELKNKKELSDEIHDPNFNLTDEQKEAVDIITRSIENDENKKFLLKGVTNSGKTEVYMHAVEKALKMEKTAIVLLPEIALAAQVEDRFKKRFGEKFVATLHSKLSVSKKLDEWLRIRSGEAKIVVGARTSVFAPLENIGIIILDEEHESTYKSDHNPKFDTIDVAFKRAKYYKSTIIMGSATPSVVSYWRSQNDIYELIEMKNRIGDSKMPELQIVDMRAELKAGNHGSISRQLADDIDKTLKNNEQVILFLNRRGYSTQIMCPDCGYHMTCPDCMVSLTYHKSSNAAVCHYCGKKFPIPKICPDCSSKFIKFSGAGTEKIQENVQAIWKDAIVDRFDIDTAKSETEIRKTIKEFQLGKTNILVGTQILAKGLDFKNVGLVGIINADTGLSIPDYRSSERTFQLITQVSGRAGRSSGKSKVAIQTYEPNSEVIIDAANYDFESFYEADLMHRNLMNYPPFSDIILVSFVTSKENCPIVEHAKKFRKLITELKGAPKDSIVLNVKEEQVRLDGKRRANFIIKAPPGTRSGYVNAYLEYKENIKNNNLDYFIEIDVNPYGIF